jgi:hypothetical protein
MSNLWVTPTELGTTYAASDYADDACQMASNILWAMSGRKYNGVTTVTERYITSINAFRYQGASAKNFFPHMIHGSVYNVPSEDWNDSGYESDGTSSLSRIRLRGKNVLEVHLVRSMYNGQIVEQDAYYVSNHSTLIAYKGTPWPPGNIEVTYTYGMRPPTAGRMAARRFAIELIKLWEGDDCALPDRVTSVSRQGVSYTILDNQDFLENMRIGIYDIDLFLKTANPAKALAPSKIFSPDISRPRRAAPSRPLVLALNSTFDVSLQRSNNFFATKVISITGGLSGLSVYDSPNYTLRLEATSWNGSLVKSYAANAADFRTTSGVLYLDLAFDYATTFQTLGPNDPGSWTLYAVDNSGATIELMQGNLQIKKVTSDQIDASALSDAGPVEFTVTRGDSFHRQITWSDDNGPVNLTGYTARMQIRASYTSATALISLTQASGLTLGGAAGTIDINITSNQTTALAAGTYVYDLEMTYGATVKTILKGTFVVTPQVTA